MKKRLLPSHSVAALRRELITGHPERVSIRAFDRMAALAAKLERKLRKSLVDSNRGMERNARINRSLVRKLFESRGQCERLRDALRRIANDETVVRGLRHEMYGHARAIAEAALHPAPTIPASAKEDVKTGCAPNDGIRPSPCESATPLRETVTKKEGEK